MPIYVITSYLHHIDLLARFPPQIVKMKQLFQIRPWDSSSGLVKKLFKVNTFCYYILWNLIMTNWFYACVSHCIVSFIDGHGLVVIVFITYPHILF